MELCSQLEGIDPIKLKEEISGLKEKLAPKEE
jgi:hypothetical protein